eukprot:scaffold184_cov316-Pinguiococcus_pyrenoidosus.AAC.1
MTKRRGGSAGSSLPNDRDCVLQLQFKLTELVFDTSNLCWIRLEVACGSSISRSSEVVRVV